MKKRPPEIVLKFAVASAWKFLWSGTGGGLLRRTRLVGCNKNPWRSIDLLANLSFVSVRRDIFIYSQKGDTVRYVKQEYG